MASVLTNLSELHWTLIKNLAERSEINRKMHSHVIVIQPYIFIGMQFVDFINNAHTRTTFNI